MRGGNLVVAAMGWWVISASAFAAPVASSVCAEVATEAQKEQLTPSLVREIQFLLSRLGMDPGPIDGVVGPETNKAIREFQRQRGWPVLDLVNLGTIPVGLLAQLRSDASRAILGGGGKSQSPANPPPATPPAAAAPAPAPTTADRFATCTYNPDDFHIGGTQYTPDKFLEVGFDGSTARAVASLKDRLDEARQLAENIGGPALLEVQRQARVLNYFDCRLKIEQAAKSNK